MIVDAHLHIAPSVRGRTGRGRVYGQPLGWVRYDSGERVRVLPPIAPVMRMTAEACLEYMDWAGVDKAVLLQGPFYGDRNASVLAATRRWPDRFAGAALVDPLGFRPLAALRRRADEGFRLLKFEMSVATGWTGIYPGLRMDQPRFVELWAVAAALGFTITLDLGAPGSASYQSAAVAALARQFPETRVVIAHLAQPPLSDPSPQKQAAWEAQILLGSLPNVWFDLSALPAYASPEDYPYAGARAAVARAAALIGADRLLWGSDAPGLLTVATYDQLLGWVSRHCDFLSAAERAQVLGDTAARVYGLAD